MVRLTKASTCEQVWGAIGDYTLEKHALLRKDFSVVLVSPERIVDTHRDYQRQGGQTAQAWYVRTKLPASHPQHYSGDRIKKKSKKGRKPGKPKQFLRSASFKAMLKQKWHRRHDRDPTQPAAAAAADGDEGVQGLGEEIAAAEEIGQGAKERTSKTKPDGWKVALLGPSHIV